MFPSLNFDSQVKRFIDACRDKGSRSSILKYFRYHPLLKVHDIARAIYLLMALEEGQDLGLSFLDLDILPSGGVRLFNRGGFPWQGLPYPAEQAELALLLLKIAEFYEDSASFAVDIARFQQVLFNHESIVFPSLWTQECGRASKEKTGLCTTLLYQLDCQVDSEYQFSDNVLGLWVQRNRSFSAYVSGSGCKSGVGAYYLDDVGIVNYGPCYGDISDCSGFGICGSPKEFSLDSNGTVIFTSSTVLPCPRLTGFSYLQDAYLGAHVVHSVHVEESRCEVISLLEDPQGMTFSIFAKGQGCQVVNGPRLRSRSLDSYKGPINDILLQGERMSLRIIASSSKMEIFSLEGGTRFWGSNFLISFPYTNGEIRVLFEKNN